jgi:hypothetical protein
LLLYKKNTSTTQVVERLPCKLKALSSNPRTKKTKQTKRIATMSAWLSGKWSIPMGTPLWEGKCLAEARLLLLTQGKTCSCPTMSVRDQFQNPHGHQNPRMLKFFI